MPADSSETVAINRSAGSSVAWGGILSIARLLSGIVRVKLVALWLGVGGVGIFSLLLQLNLTGIAVVSMSLAAPIINLGRPLLIAGQTRKVGEVAGTALLIIAINGALLMIGAALFGLDLLRHFDSAAAHALVVWTLVVSILLGACSTSFWEGVSFLTDRFDIYVRAGIAGALADMLFIGGGAVLFGLPGAIAAIPASALASFCTYAWLVGRDGKARTLLRQLSPRIALLRPVLVYSLVMLGSVAATNLGLTVLRSRVLIDAGPAANGFLQTATSLAAYILAFVTPGFWGHMYARAAAAGDTPAVRAELDKTLRLCLLISFTGCGLAAVLAELLVPLFYSAQFVGAVPLVIAYMPGELCFQLMTLLVAYQITVSKRRRYLAMSLGYILLMFVIGSFAIPRFGAVGYVAAHDMASLAMVATVMLACWRSGQLRAGFIGRAALLVATLSIMSLLLLMSSQGQNGPLVLVLLVPVAISGSMAAVRLARDFGWLGESGAVQR